MSIWTIVVLGIFLIIALLYWLLGGGTFGIWIVLAFATISVIFALNNDDTPAGCRRGLLYRIKPYRCRWCQKRFWTLHGSIKHNQKFHSELTRRDQMSGRPQNFVVYSTSGHDCNWCHGSGKINGVTCDWCGGSGKLP